ncbi:MAG TPA: DUF5103 domain-containing protein [Luteibaculaceae bacterium]|nr:DUF5103 domain-containing protein [Luteibaculaceae bacterium]
MTKRIISLFFFFFALHYLLVAQGVWQTKVYNPKIRSVNMHMQGAELSGFFFELNNPNRIVFSFDELGFDFKNYQYSFVHCNADWTQSSLLPSEYLDGYPEDYINQSSASFNTLTDFVHYEVLIPGEFTRIKKSGNYILKVFEVGNSDKPELTFRFVLYENLARIKAQIKRSDVVSERERLQEVDFSFFPPFAINNPFLDVKATLLQNGRWDNAITGLKPNFIRENEIVFNYDKESSFTAGNEYRYMDLTTIRIQTERVARIITSEGLTKITAIPDLPRYNLPYSFYRDLNGAFLIRNQDGTGSPETDADYVEVLFTLPMEAISAGTLYINGDFTAGQFNERYQMKYNYDRKAYECVLPLKQGLYNYQYVLANQNKQGASSEPVEGNFFQTENNYIILVYFRDFSADFDRVIGCYTANSLRGY